MQPVIRSALFIDFDNIFVRIRSDHGLPVAESFATSPRALIRWLEDYQIPDAPEGACRQIIVRKCYLNPVVYWRYRVDFTRAGCEVVDCPSLTQQGKSSSDIYMALGMVDALAQADPLLEEFIIVSGDADFTPVLFRLRQHGRRIIIVAPSMTSPAYKSVANLVVDNDRLVEEALQGRGGSESGQAAAAGGDGEADPSRVDQAIRECLEESGSPVSGSDLAQKIRTRFGNQGWFGHSTFKGFLDARLPALGLEYVVHRSRNWIRDPRRHGMPPVEPGTVPSHLIRPEEDPALHSLSSRFRTILDMPPLDPGAYAHLFAELARELGKGEYGVNTASRSLRDQMAQGEYPVSRMHITWILKSLRLDPGELARRKRFLAAT